MQGHTEGSYLELLGVRGCRLWSLVLTSFSWLGLGVGARDDNKDFRLVTVLQGGVLKAITDLA